VTWWFVVGALKLQWSCRATTGKRFATWSSRCASKHGSNLVGDTRDVPLHFFQMGGIICHVRPFFSFGFVFGEVSKIKVMFVTFCVKSFPC